MSDWTCANCGYGYNNTREKYEDLRDQPMALGDCLCVSCFKDACLEAIEEKQQEIMDIAEALSSSVYEAPKQ